MLRTKVRERRIRFIGEEARHGEETIAQKVWGFENCRYANIDMTPQERERRNIPLGYNDEDSNLSTVEKTKFNHEREEYMCAKALAEAGDAESIIQKPRRSQAMLKKKAVPVLCCFTSLLLWTTLSPAQETKKATPADGHDIHVVAPHVVEGVVMGPYHHYCKAVSPEVLECLIYESTDPKALLVQVEYMIAKSVTRPNVRLDLWNKHYHDHALEIASGRVQVLDRSPEEAKAIAESAAKTDGIIFHLWWPHDAKAPNGTVKFPQAISHKNRTEGPGPVDPAR